MGDEMSDEITTDQSQVADQVERSPGVWVQGDPEIAADAWIEAPSLIGAGASIGAGAQVIGSVVGADAIVGDGASVLPKVQSGVFGLVPIAR